ncbi:MAG: polysaccharide biosynthesis protein [Hyphomicrobium sp.]|nr:polysaccharide biosynthesis protein [Hyphomicrobium sp.]
MIVRGKLSLKNSSQNFRQWLLDLPRYKKRGLLVVLDLLMLSAILWVLMSVRMGVLFWPETVALALLLSFGPLITIVSFSYAGLYRMVTRYLGSRGHTRIVGAVTIAVLVWSLVVFMSGQLGVPRSAILTYGFASTAAVMMSRHMIAYFLVTSGLNLQVFQGQMPRRNVIIYGAGTSGIELSRALEHTADREVVAFCDVSPTLWGQYLGGIKVFRPDRLTRIIERYDVKEVLIAIPSSERHLRRTVLKELQNLSVDVQIMPSLADIASGKVSVTDLRPIDVADLLGRDGVPPVADLLARDTHNKNVLVTGAGGTVGAELVRQVLRQNPATVVLLDVSEPALYEIELKAREIAAQQPESQRAKIVAILGSVLDAQVVSDSISNFQIATIYHAAAYKHVPMVESNPGVGLTNNIFGTEIVAEAAIAHGVERFVLISTDKAVSPTNVMGASKRLAELVLQARATGQPSTVFTMVRFGNVLDSSGSVVGRFRRQIKAGGPVTVTHPEVIRYFMSIPEAAELVIQAGAMAKGGDVFVLDMGEPVKIVELARLMIRLSGLDVRDDQHPEGDIEIVYSGLRPGDKLFEELLIGDSTKGTEHPRILRSDEPALSPAELKRELDLLRAAIAIRDVDTIQAVLMRTVEGYRPDQETRALEKAPAATWIAPSRTLH